MPLPYPLSKLDANQVLRYAFDEDTGKLRTDASFSGSLSVSLDSLDDSVSIGDSISGNKLVVNNDGTINVNVAVEHTSDSIRLGDGTNYLTSTNIASKYGLDVNVINGIDVTGSVDALMVGINEFVYNETTIAAGGTTAVVSQLFPTEYKLRRVRGTGENLGAFVLKFNGTGVDKILTTYTDFNSLMDYETGITIPAGTTVSVEVTNSSNTPAIYSVQLLYSAK